MRKTRKILCCSLLAAVIVVSGCGDTISQYVQEITDSAAEIWPDSESGEDSFSTNIFGTAEEVTEPEEETETQEFDEALLASVTARAESNYYYNLLSESEKSNYIYIAAAIQEQRESVKLRETDAENAAKIYSCVLMDYPEYFWCDASYKYYESMIAHRVEIIPQYNCGMEERQQRQQAVSDVVAQIIAQAPVTEDNYEEIKYVYEYIINNTDYQLDAPENQNIFSVFNNRASVCAGYAKAMQYLLNQMGIYCIYVSGTTDTGELHAWNIVQCGGEYCYVDTTWGDPVYMETMQSDNTMGGNISYDYLCCSGELMQRTHTADPQFALPECTATAYEYYRRAGRYFYTVDENQLLGIMENDISQQAERSDMQFASEELYQQAKALCESSLYEQAAQYLGSYYGLSSISYYHQSVDDTWRLSVWWTYA